MDRGQGNDPPFVRGRDTGDEEDTESIVRMAIIDAIQYSDEELGPDRALATEFYAGKQCGSPAETGRSAAILTEVRDGILGVLPSCIRVIHGPEHVVDVVPNRADTVAQAEQATDYLRYIYEQDNKGLLVTHSTLKDGLLKRLGVIKWGMDEGVVPRTTVYRGLDREQLAELASDDRVTLSAPQHAGEGLYDIEATVMEPQGRIWVKPVPPDDFFWNREARSLEDSILVGHRERLTRGELRAMGVSEDDIEEYGGTIGESTLTPEEIARRTNAVSGFSLDPEMGVENRRMLFCEVYMMLGVPGTDRTELRRLWTLGSSHQLIRNKPATERPFAMFCPDPEPHAMLGGSWYDLLKEPQKINSQLLRGMLDSLSISLFPRPIYVDGQASVADILNTAIGAPVRERQPNMVRWDAAPFTGEKVMPIMGFMRDVIERRIGQKDGAGGLDMDALQSTGKEAVTAAITAATAQYELIVRLWCEQVGKPLMRGLLHLATLPQSKDRIIRLRGAYVPVQPATWDRDMDVTVSVALGSMDTAKKIATLDAVIADQSTILSTYGPDNPVVSIAMLRNAKAKRLSLSGIKDVESYYKPVDPNWQPPPPAPPQPSSDELWIQAEKQMAFEKGMKELAIKQDELAMKVAQNEADNAFRDRELALKEEESVRKLTEGPHNAEIERLKAEMASADNDARIASQERIAAEQNAVTLQKAVMDAELQKYIAGLEADTARHAAEVAAVAKASTPAPEPKEKVAPVTVNVGTRDAGDGE